MLNAADDKKARFSMPGRSGCYVRQPSGYGAFIPAALPPAPAVRIDGELQRLPSEADFALGRLDGSIQPLPNCRAAGNGYLVLEQLYEQPILSVNDMRDLVRTTYPAANQLVERMVRLGILEEMTGQARNRRFQYTPYVRLFNEQREGEAG